MQGNNPGNIRLIPKADGSLPAPFIGEIRPNNGAMRKFGNLESGIRAMMKVVLQDIHAGLDTPYRLITSYAPKGDGANNPIKYARDVSDMVGMSPTDKISSTRFVPFVKGMTRIETGTTIPVDAFNRVAKNIDNDGYFKNLPASPGSTGVGRNTTGFAWWYDKKKRIEVLTVGGLVVGAIGLYEYNKKKKRSRR